jgi:hypothetical protein
MVKKKNYVYKIKNMYTKKKIISKYIEIKILIYSTLIKKYIEKKLFLFVF